ncbi:unnamed protein product [Aphis gossypii]|uniref:Uncharacterized protein n=1 Tax=Aphis gossypii TaxID=80765 RepID=A0A9P0IUE5_APHGO|nr:unnamed protein product [Aphis gossypii]
MLCVKKILLSALCLTILMSKINSGNQYHNSTLYIQYDNEITHVRDYNSKISCRIYINKLLTEQPDIEDKGMNFIPNQSIAFYLCINCFFAEWVQNRLIELVQNIPYMYIDKPIIRNKFIDDINKSDKSIKYIMEKTEYFINVLSNFINKHSYNSTNKMVDTSFFQLLVSTNILLNYVLSKDLHMDVEKTLTRILRIINQAQKFMAYNCDIISSDYNNAFFFSYSMTKLKTNKYHIDIDSFFNGLRRYDLVTIETERCEVPNMFLRDIISSNNIVSEVLKKSSILIDDKYIQFIEFFDLIETSDNLNSIFWYMQIILDIIINFICKKMLEVLRSEWSFDRTFTAGFKMISFLFTNVTIDDEQLIDGFKLLASNSLIEDSDRSKLQKTIYNYVSTKKIQQDQFDSNFDQKEKPMHTIKMYIVTLTDNYSLEEFMNAIINRNLDYKCLVNVFEILKIDHKQNYMLNPYSLYRFMRKNNKKILEKWIVSFHSGENEILLCPLVTKIYRYCVEYGIALTGNKRAKGSPIEINTKETIDFLKCISDFMNSLVLLNQTSEKNRFLTELIMEIFPVIMTKQDALNYPLKIHNLVRIIYVVMIALDKYALEVCKGKIKNNFLFNDVEYDRIGEHPNQNMDVLKDWKKRLPDLNVQDNSNSLNLTYSFKKLKDAFDIKSDCEIRVFWAGGMKTKDEIYEIVESQILNPFYVYALYDIYLKYIMAILYCELITVLEKLLWYTGFKPVHRSNDATVIHHTKRMKVKDNILPKEFMDIYKICVDEFEENYRSTLFFSPDSDNIKQLKRVIQKSGIDIVLKIPDIFNQSYLQKKNDDEWDASKELIENTMTEYNKKNNKISERLNTHNEEFLKLKKFYRKYVIENN